MGKRTKKLKNKKNKIKTILRRITILLLFLTIIYIAYGIYKESTIRVEQTPNISQIYEQVITNEIKTEKVNTYIPKTYLNYKVSSQLEIPKINLNVNVLEEYSEETLEIFPCKYWGPEPNQIGNYCIAGHNHEKENMFNNLIDLGIGDEIYLTDNKNGKYVYTIYDIYRVKPENIEPLSQQTNGKREITLITCVNYSKHRLIIKAIENSI